MNEHNGVIQVGHELPPLPAAEAGRHASKAKMVKGPAKERFRTMNDFVDFTLRDLGRAEMAVWLVLWRDTRDGTARTAYDDLARRAGLNRRNVGRAIRRLETRGLVQVVHRGGLRQGPSRYRVRPLAKDG